MKPISDFILKPVPVSNLTCSFCNKKCKSKRACLIGQILEQINHERIGTKYKKVSFVAIAMKVKHLSDDDVSYSLSICRDSKNRLGSFSKCFFGSLKTR